MTHVTGGWTSALFLEQRIHTVADGGEQPGDHADNVPGAVPHEQGTLEPHHRDARLQRAEDVHGDELETVRRAHR